MSRMLEAVRSGDVVTISSIASEDPDALKERAEDGTSLMLQALYHRQPAAVEVLQGIWGEPDLFEAAALGDLETLEKLLEADPALLEERSPDGFTPLHLAAFFGREAALELLLSHGADHSSAAQNELEVTPLNSAAAGVHVEVVQKLLQAGADPNAKMAQGFTPLMAAAGAANTELVEMLLTWGADPTAVAEDGRTARDMAAEHGDPGVLDLL